MTSSVYVRFGPYLYNYICLLHGPTVMLLMNYYIRNKFSVNRKNTERNINPFTAPACTISWLKSAHTCLKTTFSGPITYVLSSMCVWMKIFSLVSAKKKTKRLKDFRCRLLVVFKWHHGSQRDKNVAGMCAVFT